MRARRIPCRKRAGPRSATAAAFPTVLASGPGGFSPPHAPADAQLIAGGMFGCTPTCGASCACVSASPDSIRPGRGLGLSSRARTTAASKCPSWPSLRRELQGYCRPAFQGTTSARRASGHGPVPPPPCPPAEPASRGGMLATMQHRCGTAASSEPLLSAALPLGAAGRAVWWRSTARESASPRSRRLCSARLTS